MNKERFPKQTLNYKPRGRIDICEPRASWRAEGNRKPLFHEKKEDIYTFFFALITASRPDIVYSLIILLAKP